MSQEEVIKKCKENMPLKLFIQHSKENLDVIYYLSIEDSSPENI